MLNTHFRRCARVIATRRNLPTLWAIGSEYATNSVSRQCPELALLRPTIHPFIMSAYDTKPPLDKHVIFY